MSGINMLITFALCTKKRSIVYSSCKNFFFFCHQFFLGRFHHLWLNWRSIDSYLPAWIFYVKKNIETTCISGIFFSLKRREKNNKISLFEQELSNVTFYCRIWFLHLHHRPNRMVFRIIDSRSETLDYPWIAPMEQKSRHWSNWKEWLTNTDVYWPYLLSEII